MKRHTPQPTPEVLAALIEAAIQNATSLIAEADCLSERKFWARTHFLASTALEELAKAQLVADIGAGALPPEALAHALGSHERKYAFLKRPASDSDGLAASSSAQAFGKAAKRLRELSLYAGLSSTGDVLTPLAVITQEQAAHTLLAAHRELSTLHFLGFAPDGLTTKGARAFGKALDKTEA